MWLDSTGKTQPLKGLGFYSTPSLSPEGERLAFTQTNDISVYDWQRDTTSRLSFTPGPNSYPVWTPDGRGIVYRSAPGGVGNLYWVRPTARPPPCGLPSRRTTRRHSRSRPTGSGSRFKSEAELRSMTF